MYYKCVYMYVLQKNIVAIFMNILYIHMPMHIDTPMHIHNHVPYQE